MQGRISHRENLLSGHSRFLLTREEAESIIDDMSAAIKANWYNCFRRHGVSERDCGIIASAFVYEGFWISASVDRLDDS